jgi:predicted HTH transcriptional regulator
MTWNPCAWLPDTRATWFPQWAVCCCSARIEVVFPDAWIQCGRFIGKDRADIFDHIDIHEHLPVAVERVMEFLKKHAMRGADFSELRRKDV